MRIAYYTAGGRDFASSRLRAFMIGDALSAMGHEVTFGTPTGHLADVYVFQKRFDMASLMVQLRKWGKLVVWDCDDYIPNGPVDLADVVTVDTPAKLALYPNAVVVPDALDISPTSIVRAKHADKLSSVVWIGNPENVYHTANVAEACRLLHLHFDVITRREGLNLEDVPINANLYEWDAESSDLDIIDCDVVACSYIPDGRWSAEWVRSKSANRLLKAWGLGMPVIGTPIPSYVEAGLVHQATTVEEWVTALEAMKPVQMRLHDAERGHRIARNYRADVIAKRWLEVFETCMQPH